MLKGFKVKLHPTNEQIKYFHKSFGIARFAYNWALNRKMEHFQETGKTISGNDLRKELTQLKKTSEYAWLYDVSCNVAKQSIRDLDDAHKDFLKRKIKRYSPKTLQKAKCTGKKLTVYDLEGHPKFKSRKDRIQSFYNNNESTKFTKNTVQLEKLGVVKLGEENRIPFEKHNKYFNPRVKFDGLNYWITVSVEVGENQAKKPQTEPIGIDLGIKTLAFCSNKKEYKKPNIKNEKKKLKRLQRKASRHYEKIRKEKHSKSKNLLKLEKQILKQYQRITNILNNNIHQMTSELIKLNPLAIVVEDLNVKWMLKNKYLSEKIKEAKLSEIRRQLEYKCERNNIKFIVADRFYASSKICSNCGNKKQKLSLSERIYRCECCGFVIDRDFNASINLRNLAL